MVAVTQQVEVAAAVDVEVVDVEAVVADPTAVRAIPRVGIGFRYPIADWILTQPEEIEFVEVTAEHFFDGGDEILERLASLYPISVHGLGLSLGTPGPLCKSTLESFSRVAALCEAAWVSEHIAFTRSKDLDLGHLNPVPLTRESLETFVNHAMQVQDQCQKPLVLENITTNLRASGDIPETDFLNELCRKADIGLLLDVTNLFINSKNHDFDPITWVKRLDPSFIRQLHIVGYSRTHDHYHDRHCEPVQEDLLELASFVVSNTAVESIILERDENLPTTDVLAQELKLLEGTCAIARSR